VFIIIPSPNSELITPNHRERQKKMTRALKTIIIGFGNDILGDDGIGCVLASDLAETLELPGATCSMYGFEIIEKLAGYERAVIIDAITTADGTVGDIYRFAESDFVGCRHLASPHSTDFSAGLEFGRLSGIDLPTEVVIFGVEAKAVSEFRDTLSSAMQNVYPAIKAQLLETIQDWLGSEPAERCNR